MSNFEVCPFCKSKVVMHDKGGVGACSNKNCYIHNVWIPIDEWPDDNRVEILQYKSLRNNFSKMVKDVMGPNYYTMATDVYGSDAECCEDVTRKANNKRLERFIGW